MALALGFDERWRCFLAVRREPSGDATQLDGQSGRIGSCRRSLSTEKFGNFHYLHGSVFDLVSTRMKRASNAVPEGLRPYRYDLDPSCATIFFFVA